MLKQYELERPKLASAGRSEGQGAGSRLRNEHRALLTIPNATRPPAECSPAAPHGKYRAMRWVASPPNTSVPCDHLDNVVHMTLVCDILPLIANYM